MRKALRVEKYILFTVSVIVMILGEHGFRGTQEVSSELPGDECFITSFFCCPNHEPNIQKHVSASQKPINTHEIKGEKMTPEHQIVKPSEVYK